MDTTQPTSRSTSEQINTQKPLALVTGASSGIGLELAKVFANHGFDLAIVSDGPGIKEAASDLRNLGVNVDAFQIDLAPWEGVDHLIASLKALGRPIDCAALNAGFGLCGDFARETSLDEERKMIELNVLSTMHLAKHLTRDMVAQGYGRLLFLSSVVGVMPSPLQTVYAATKAFVHSFSEGLRSELADTAISVTALMPGVTDTDFFDDPSFEGTKVKEMKKDDPSLVARQGFEAMMAGKDHVVGGSVTNKISVAINKFLTEAGKAVMPKTFGQPAGH